MGVDYRIYEGNNTIGREPGNSITITKDTTISGTHANILYKKGKFYKQIIDNNNYKINSYKKNKNKFIAKTYDGNTINILLRWKNGNGIAFPAFQIS